jgi:hypothetical protein
VARERSWYFGSFEHFMEKRQSIFPPNIPASLAAGEDFSRQPKIRSYRLFGKYNQALNFDRYGRESFQIPQGVGFFNPGDDQIRLRNDCISLFAQDDWASTSPTARTPGSSTRRT